MNISGLPQRHGLHPRDEPGFAVDPYADSAVTTLAEIISRARGYGIDMICVPPVHRFITRV